MNRTEAEALIQPHIVTIKNYSVVPTEVIKNFLGRDFAAFEKHPILNNGPFEDYTYSWNAVDALTKKWEKPYTNPVLLFREEETLKGELQEAEKHLSVCKKRTECKNNLVVGRYSVLPYYKELERDLESNNCYLINSYDQHRWIADFEYYEVLKDYTFESWDDNNFYQCKHPGPFVVKGKTNSRKHRWNKSMFAETKRQASELAIELAYDSLIGPQGVIYRKYVPLKRLETGLYDLPITNEWRFFYLGDKRLAHGYYWSNADDVSKGTIDEVGLNFADEVAKIVSKHVNFFVLDIAEKEEGGWVLVEVNDAQMSGLSEVDPKELYANLAKEI